MTPYGGERFINILEGIKGGSVDPPCALHMVLPLFLEMCEKSSFLYMAAPEDGEHRRDSEDEEGENRAIDEGCREIDEKDTEIEGVADVLIYSRAHKLLVLCDGHCDGEVFA